MIEAQITALGDAAAAALQTDSGAIIAVFNRSVYLQAGNGSMCCVTSHTVPPGPLNAQTTLPDSIELSAADGWRIDGEYLTLGTRYRLCTASADQWKAPTPATHSVSCRRLQHASARILRALQQATPSTDTKVQQVIALRLAQGQQALTNWLHHSANRSPEPAAITTLIGCGDGLTPAGDDILIGTLVALTILAVSLRLPGWHRR